MSGATSSRTAATTVVLEWRGPYSFRSDDRNSVFVGSDSAAPGLYLWTVPTQTGFLIHRVGATPKPFWQCHVEHLEAFERGANPIYRASSLATGRRNLLYPGQVGDKNQREMLRARFLNSRPKLQKELDDTLGLLAIFLAPETSERRVLQRTQTVLQARLVDIGGQVSAFLERPLGSSVRTPEEAPIRVRSVAGGKIRGVEGEFIV
jgi:hypothetical protein